MHSLEIKNKFIDFFKSKRHKVLTNVSIIPENDPTVLFNIAGVQPIIPNIISGRHPLGKRLCSVQRCLRTIDIEEVGDNRHNTFFEMLGRWSVGDYFKKEAIESSMEFLVNQLKLDPKRIYITVFCGENNIPQDKESITIWKRIFNKYGIKASIFDSKKGENKNVRIFPLGMKENFWGPTTETGPCGPSSEIYYRFGKGKAVFSKSRPGFNDGEEYIEIWNDVFMEFEKTKEGKFIPLKQKNVDTGAGFERICGVVQNREKDGSILDNSTMYNTDLFDTPSAYLRSLIEDETKKSLLKEEEIVDFDYSLTNLENTKVNYISFRITLDHLRACTFMIADGIEPSNKDRGYILRRLIRRAIRHARLLKINKNFTKDLVNLYIEKYKIQYPHLAQKKDDILNVLEREEINFEKTIERGIKEIDKLTGKGKKVTGKDLFNVYETYGFPLEMALDELGITSKNERKIYEIEFNNEKDKHQKLSRKGGEGRFIGGLSEHSEITKRFHTTTHLLLKALQIVLGSYVHQRGSNITKDRLRFDFPHNKKLSEEEIKKVESIVNKAIKDKLEIEKKEMKKDEALRLKAECEFPEKYPEIVTVYTIKNPKTEDFFSRELCGGPHVKNTSEIGKSGKFKIIKEESSGAGIRRIKAVLEKARG